MEGEVVFHLVRGGREGGSFCFCFLKEGVVENRFNWSP